MRRCPACQETKWLVDLEVEPDGATRPPPGGRSTVGAFGGVGLLGLLGAGTAAGLGSFGVAEVLLIPTVLALAVAVVARPPQAKSTPWTILPGPVARAHAPRASVAGVVRAARGVKLLRSPLHDRVCVAYRISGASADMPIDDARGRPFDVHLDDGERVRVDATVATIDLVMNELDERMPLPPGRAVFLKHRGVEALDTARVTESTLEIGARVVVIGAAREDVIASGYRETRMSRTIFDAPGAPLLIRPALETPRAIQESRDASA